MDDLSWPTSTMSFATFYQDVKLAQKALEEATRTRTGDNTFKIDTPNVGGLLRGLPYRPNVTTSGGD